MVVGALIARSGARKELRGVHAAAGTLALATLAAVLALHWTHTGAPFPASATARAMDARRAVETLEIAGVHVYGGLVLRLLAYAGLTYLALEGARAGRHGAAAVAVVGVIFYTFVVGSSQVARQGSWIFACLAALAGAGAARLLANGARERCAVAIVALLGTSFAETATRFAIPTQRRGGAALSDLREAPVLRRAQTDALLDHVCAGGCCTGEPVPVALIEVQRRFYLDERVRVVSLDGRTAPARSSPEQVTYDAHGCPDVDALLERARVVAVLDRPRFAPPCAPASLAARWGEPQVDGFRFDAALPGYVRSCDGDP